MVANSRKVNHKEHKEGAEDMERFRAFVHSQFGRSGVFPCYNLESFPAITYSIINKRPSTLLGKSRLTANSVTI